MGYKVVTQVIFT